MPEESDIKRSIYRAEVKPDTSNTEACVKAVNQLQNQMDTLLTLSLFRWEAMLFLYAESAGSPASPEYLFGDLESSL